MDVITSNLGLFSWIIFGALAGWVASLVAGGNSRLGCLGNIVVGVVGAFLGGWIYSLITGHPLLVGWNWTAFIVAVIGAIILLAIINLVTGSSSRK
ncbi:MAG TPA: GlsB/YeaQ/YmgE family stress response membrane protein [Ktedonobacteraceae bacterium]|nr:GlsB/YeaQ/YmgE family stress response membrane protein [Ktedonobacteraceae bacterium]